MSSLQKITSFTLSVSSPPALPKPTRALLPGFSAPSRFSNQMTGVPLSTTYVWCGSLSHRRKHPTDPGVRCSQWTGKRGFEHPAIWRPTFFYPSCPSVRGRKTRCTTKTNGSRFERERERASRFMGGQRRVLIGGNSGTRFGWTRTATGFLPGWVRSTTVL